ncbi:T Cell Receptor Alpha Variable 9-2 [Manis pentadactyla]|nr:T Cell Receptor Alpha Variable 9-2 [Manis pentadactyla]
MFLHVTNEEHYLGDTVEMNYSPGVVTMVFLLIGQARGDSVAQMEGQVTFLERDSLTMNCTYSATGYPTLFCQSPAPQMVPGHPGEFGE